jgi:hypothetical protein
MVGDHSVDSESRHRLVYENHRYAARETFIDDTGRRRAIHHDDRANAILEHALDERAHVALGIRSVEEHALKPVREERGGERGEAFGVEWLVQVSADQTNNIGVRNGQTLREPVDAVA